MFQSRSKATQAMATTSIATRISRWFTVLVAAFMALGVVLPVASPVAQAEYALQTPEPAHAAATGFLFYKFPVSQPACTGFGLNVSGNAYFSSDDCGFVPFGFVGADGTADVVVTFFGPDGAEVESQDALYDSIDEEWQFSITPETTWPAGLITAVVFVDGEDAGRTTFGHRLLGASMAVDAGGAPYEPGDDLPISGNIAELDTITNATGVQRTGVPSTFSLAVRTPAGEVRPVPGGPITAGATGDFSATVPGSLTADIEPVGGAVEVTIAVLAVDASYDDPSTGEWAAANAGSAPVALLAAPDALTLEASFVSSVGWVKPGEGYPFRVFVTNATTSDATDVTVTLDAPPSATFQDATPLTGAGTAALTPTTITWNVGTLPAATAAGPNVRTLVVSATAASLASDPEVVWKDLSTTATLTYAGYSGAAITSSTHGPKVIPPAAEFDSARYGDKPFPMVPVEWVDLDRQSNDTWDNDSEKLDYIVNDPDFVGSTFNLYQEMSFGQLYPNGTVPSAGIATATYSEYAPGFDFTTTDRTNPLYAGCRGATAAEPGLVGTPAFDTRIDDGWYQMPGTTEYYGGDFPAFTATTVAIDQACGPIGKAVFDAAQIADPEIDYNQYDSDKDGVVDFFMMVFVGCGGNGASQIAVICEYFGNQAPFYDNIWPHSASLEGMYQDQATGLRGYISDDQLKSLHEIPQCWTSSDRTQYDDCAANGGLGVDSLPVYVRVGPYNVNPETVFQSASVISHEYGHHLGLPDFYGSESIYGDLNLMAADYSQNMTIFGKQEMGWVVPQFLEPGETRTVSNWNEVKRDIGEIRWVTPNGDPYTLSAANGDQNIRNGEAYALKLGGRQLIDPDAIPSGTHAWWSGRGNDFGCPPTGGHNMDIALPELAAFPAGTTVTVEFASSFDIEWDYDYGFVLTTTDGVGYTSHPSQNGYTTTNDFNPNNNGCLAGFDNGLTGTSGAWEQGVAVATAARNPVANDYSHGAPFIPDVYDISDLAGSGNAVLRFSYATDPGLDRPGWFIDDIVVKADGQVIYSTDVEHTDDLHKYTLDGWSRVNASDDNPADHAYYLELRDQSGFDFDGHGQSDRGDTAWQPGVFIEYTDEAHGYGNNGTPPPPAQHYLDSQPIPGSDCGDEQTGNCADVSFTSAAGDDFFTDAITATQPGGFVNSFSDPNSKYGDDLWHFDYGCLTLDVTSMAGQGIGPVTPAHGDITADAVISAGDGCAPFGYGAGDNLPPTAVAQAKPTETTVDSPVTFDGSASSDDRQAPSQLTYAWDFGDGNVASGQSVVHAYTAEGVYTATLTVTDADGASDTDTVMVTVTDDGGGGGDDGEGRVHGSGWWDRGTGDKHDKVDFSFNVKTNADGLHGKLQLHDKDLGLKVNARTITSLSSGAGIECDGTTLDGVSSFAFTASGGWDADGTTGEGTYFACGVDNGKNNSSPVDVLYVRCDSGCTYDSGARTADNDIDAGNIHLKESIVDPESSETTGGAPASPPTGGDPEPAAAGTSGESSGESSEEAQVVDLDPILFSYALEGTPVLLTAVVESSYALLDGSTVKLVAIAADGAIEESYALTNTVGVATFVVTMPSTDVEYHAVVDGVESNGVRISVGLPNL